MTQETEELLKERHRLACERISEIARETDIGEEAAGYFQKTAKFLMLIEQAAAELEEGNTHCMRTSFRKIMRPAMRIQPMQRKSWEKRRESC